MYGVAGEGRGHASRSAALWPFLSKSMDLTILCPESIAPFIQEKCPPADLDLIPGIHFSLQGHRVDYFGSIQKNLPLLFRFNEITDTIAENMKKKNVQGVISDFEPLTAVAAWKAGLPLLNLNHPAVVRRYLSLLPDAVTARLVATVMTPPAQKNIICSFYDGDVGPILRDEIRKAVPVKGDYILVYVKESSSDEVKSILAEFPHQEFRYFPDKKKDFITSLAGCAGVIAPAGHQLLSESLYLRKPVLALPQKGQYEQRLNARMLTSSGWGRGSSLSRLKKDAAEFIKDLNKFPFKSDPYHQFILEDHTARTAQMISSFFETEKQKSRLSPRVHCDYFQYLPEKLRRLKSLSA
jgi:uncharacterized protein (TIGR00661 family)